MICCFTANNKTSSKPTILQTLLEIIRKSLLSLLALLILWYISKVENKCECHIPRLQKYYLMTAIEVLMVIWQCFFYSLILILKIWHRWWYCFVNLIVAQEITSDHKTFIMRHYQSQEDASFPISIKDWYEYHKYIQGLLFA